MSYWRNFLNLRSSKTNNHAVRLLHIVCLASVALVSREGSPMTRGFYRAAVTRVLTLTALLTAAPTLCRSTALLSWSYHDGLMFSERRPVRKRCAFEAGLFGRILFPRTIRHGYCSQISFNQLITSIVVALWSVFSNHSAALLTGCVWISVY